MKYLNKLKLVAQQQKRLQTKAEMRRAKLIGRLEEQLAMAEAFVKGERYMKTRKVWLTNEEGVRGPVDRPKRLRSWYWGSQDGFFLNIWYGNKMLDIQDGLTAIQVGKREDIPNVIRSVMEAVNAGELDVQIEAIAEKGLPELRLSREDKAIQKGIINSRKLA